MATESPDKPPQTSEVAPPEPLSPPPASSSSTFQPTWQLAPGIENHIEALVLKSLIGGTVGAAVGFVLFRSGRGANAAAGSAFGIGCAVGSFIERSMANGDVDPDVPNVKIPDVKIPDIFSGWKSQ
ncbi:hypothetical protein ACHAXH_004174 [Discostella pseudostelligera]|jgi:hypothetical protein